METMQSIALYSATRSDCIGNELASEERIKQIVVQYFGVNFSDLTTKSRRRDVGIPRQVIMYFLVYHTHLPYRAIGSMFGGRDHTTAIHAKDKIKDLMDSDPDFREEVYSIKEKIFPIVERKKIESKDEFIESYREAIQILGNLRNVQREWDETCGLSKKDSKKYWEGKADQFLKNIGGQPEINIPSQPCGLTSFLK